MTDRFHELTTSIAAKLNATEHLALFEAALTRRAWNLEQGTPDGHHHEPLEWLGDRVLGSIVATELWTRFPFAEPGRLDIARDTLTSERPLAVVARRLHLSQAVRMGEGEHLQGQVRKNKPLSDHVEALVGAAYLAGGWSAATTLVLSMLSDRFPDTLPPPSARMSGDHDGAALTALSQTVQRTWRANLSKESWSVERVGVATTSPSMWPPSACPTAANTPESPVSAARGPPRRRPPAPHWPTSPNSTARPERASPQGVHGPLLSTVRSVAVTDTANASASHWDSSGLR